LIKLLSNGRLHLFFLPTEAVEREANSIGFLPFVNPSNRFQFKAPTPSLPTLATVAAARWRIV
jgi:hypothetical protein